MSLALSDQWAFAHDVSFQHRVAAAVYNTAIAVYGGAPAADEGVQRQRITLATQALEEGTGTAPTLPVLIFCWLTVAVPTLTSVDDLGSDTLLLTVAATYFNNVSQLLYPLPVTP